MKNLSNDEPHNIPSVPTFVNVEKIKSAGRSLMITVALGIIIGLINVIVLNQKSLDREMIDGIIALNILGSIASVSLFWRAGKKLANCDKV